MAGRSNARLPKGRSSFRELKRGYHHLCEANYWRLKETDPLDTFDMGHYIAFCWDYVDDTCLGKEHEQCRQRGYCTRNPLESDYRDFIAGNPPMPKGRYLELRLQGKTGEWFPERDGPSPEMSPARVAQVYGD